MRPQQDDIQVIKPESCGGCGAILGNIVQIREKLYFDGGGGVLAWIGFKRCHCCGRTYNWDGEKMQAEYRAFVVSPHLGA